MPLARKTFAGRQKHNAGERIPTDKKPAKWAMGRIISLTERSLCTAARHADARSLAVRVSRGTMNPTNHLCVITVTNQTPTQQSTACPRGHGDRLLILILLLLLLRRVDPVHRTLRRTRFKSYAFFLGLRIAARQNKSLARFVPTQDRPYPIFFYGVQRHWQTHVTRSAQGAIHRMANDSYARLGRQTGGSVGIFYCSGWTFLKSDYKLLAFLTGDYRQRGPDTKG